MGTAVRRVPSDWAHPKDEGGRYLPLRDGLDFERRARQWDEHAAKWQQGLRRDLDMDDWEPIKADLQAITYAEYEGPRPDPQEYTAQWPAAECTHWQMYEEVTDGTPISPVCASAEELARWMADHDANARGGTLMSYLDWLALIRQTPVISLQR
jgi:hypothetical protein